MKNMFKTNDEPQWTDYLYWENDGDYKYGRRFPKKMDKKFRSRHC